ncbi:hypothetical protein ACFLU5_08145 [Bacteroidota bacterium]
MAVQEGGAKLVMMDGTIWMIKPEDIPTTGTWVPPSGMEIKESSTVREYDYTITNLSEGKTVSASKRR